MRRERTDGIKSLRALHTTLFCPRAHTTSEFLSLSLCSRKFQIPSCNYSSVSCKAINCVKLIQMQPRIEREVERGRGRKRASQMQTKLKFCLSLLAQPPIPNSVRCVRKWRILSCVPQHPTTPFTSDVIFASPRRCCANLHN